MLAFLKASSVLTLALTLTSLPTAYSATLAELITQNAALVGPRIAGAVATHPEWSAPGQNTLLVPTAQALAAANLGDDLGDLFTSVKAVDWRAGSANEPIDIYLILKDDKREKRVVWDDYGWGNPAKVELHIRFGSGSGVAVRWFPADNGFLYIMDVAIPPSTPTAQLLGSQASGYWGAVQSAGLADKFSAFRNVTFWTPTNAAWTAYAAQYRALSPSQQSWLLHYHITTPITYSYLMPNGERPSIISGRSLPLQVLPGEGNSTIAGSRMGSPADNILAGGVAQFVQRVLVPTGAIPDVEPVLVGGLEGGAVANATTTTTTTTTTVPITSAAPSVTAAAPSPAVKVSGAAEVKAIGFGFLTVLAGAVSYLL
ncbi:hypothetical protein HK097_006788 [Rhizophlyctis rosea]|uniref:FAS1 domain-containing protein n=1 Tax=Rhizophlyctis rosea TaxID=64517 RepID=A0AAD5SLQ6_9FUNG|nr:hypothetical protein HK097_006788 [Rhizophlyctis rosea]